MTKLTNEEIKMLAECERAMDSGEIPFVMLDGFRTAVPKTTMSKLGLSQGQTINRTIFSAILETNIADLQEKIAAKATADILGKASPSKELKS